MAKKKTVKKKVVGTKKVNKSQAIRDYNEKNSDAGPTAITAALEKKGIAVTTGMVSTVLNKAKKGGARKSNGRGRRKKSAQVSGDVGIGQLKMAAKLIAECGGADVALKAVKDAEAIRSS